MDKLVTSLRKKYRERLLHREKQWPPVSGERLVNLQLVEAEKKEGFRAGLPQHGAGDDQVKCTPILHGDLFKADRGKKPVRKAIVEGNAGIGKTMLCTMLTEEWAEGKILTQFDCVILLPLREKSVASATSLPQLFKLLHSSERIRASAIQEMEEKEGEGALIIADGWDELDDTNRSEDSFLYNLLFGDTLPFASVLLTSRPSASAPLHSLPSADRLIEVVGFNDENIKQYIEAEFESSPNKASSLLNQLEDNLLIHSICSVPLNCAIICHLWSTLKQELPTTLTELYIHVFLNVILRDLQKGFNEFQSQPSFKNFDSLPDECQETFKLTCRFAFECLSQDKIVFYEEELEAVGFQEIVSSAGKGPCFGLLQSARSLLPVGQGLSFHFAHLSFQEFLAALHLVTLSTEEKLKVVEAHAKRVRFQNVWKFVFGLGCKKQSPCSRNVVCLDELFVDQFMSRVMPLERWRCVMPGRNIKSKDVAVNGRSLMIHCAFESMNDTVCTKLAKHFNGRLSGFTSRSHDCVAAFHVIRHSVGHCPDLFIYLPGCNLTGKHLSKLTDSLSSANGKLQVTTLNLSQNKLYDAGVNDLFERASASFSTLVELQLSRNNITDIMPSFMHIPCSTLTTLLLCDNPLGVSGIQSLEMAVQAGLLDNLEVLFLSNTLTDDADINGALLTTLLPSIASQCPHLRMFDLDRNNLGVPGAYALGYVLTHFQYKERFHLSNTKLNNEAVIILSESACAADMSLGDESTLISCNPFGYDGLLALFRMLRSQIYPTRKLCLFNTDCSTLTQSRSPNMPPTNKLSPKVLNLGPPLGNSLGLTTLEVSKINFSGDRVFVLAECMRVCRSLKQLGCRDCSLTSADISNIITQSSGHSNLMSWDLSNNCIEDSGVDALTKSIPELFPCLVVLTLYNNPVSNEAKKRLDTCLQANKNHQSDHRRYFLESRDMEQRALYEWLKTQSPPQSKELLSVFLRMWDELCWILSYFVYTRNRYPHLYGLPSELSRPATPSDDESFHSATEESSCCPTVQSLLGVRPREDTEVKPTKKPRLSSIIQERNIEHHDESMGHYTLSDGFHQMDLQEQGETSAIGVSSPQNPHDIRMTTPPRTIHPPDNVLNIKDLSKLYEIMHKAAAKWFYIGLGLGQNNGHLENIDKDHRNCEDCLRVMLAKCLQASTITKTQLCDCLRKDTVRRDDIAEEIEELL